MAPDHECKAPASRLWAKLPLAKKSGQHACLRSGRTNEFCTGQNVQFTEAPLCTPLTSSGVSAASRAWPLGAAGEAPCVIKIRGYPHPSTPLCFLQEAHCVVPKGCSVVSGLKRTTYIHKKKCSTKQTLGSTGNDETRKHVMGIMSSLHLLH